MVWKIPVVLAVSAPTSIVALHAVLLTVNLTTSTKDSLLAIISDPVSIVRGAMTAPCMRVPAGIIRADGWGGIVIVTTSVSLDAEAIVLAANCGMRLAGANMMQAAPEDRVQ